MSVKAVAFDLGETLVDEARFWDSWARWIGVRPFELHAAIGGAIALRQDHNRAFAWLRPDLDLEELIARRRSEDPYYGFVEEDLFEDARPCLTELRRRGLRACIAGNQSAWFAEELSSWALPVEFVSNVEALGAAKPAPVFFANLAARLALAPAEIAYVGDRVDNDVLPAADAGMVAVLLRRGPWATQQSQWPEAARAHHTIESLAELPEALAA